MTVKELKEALEGIPDDYEVVDYMMSSVIGDVDVDDDSQEFILIQEDD